LRERHRCKFSQIRWRGGNGAGACLAGSDFSPQYPTKAERRKYGAAGRAETEPSLSFLSRIFGDKGERAALRPLYAAVVRAGRDPAWYREGGVPDTIDGRFDILSALLALVLLRLEREGEATRRASVLLTEAFIDDMDGTLRQLGIGDVVVGKHVGKIMGALGGRLGALRGAFAGDGDLAEAVRRNVFREAPPSDEAVAFVAAGLERFHRRLEATATAPLLAGETG
jgi:cytochrome b pre-mRNA-processing protein 3